MWPTALHYRHRYIPANRLRLAQPRWASWSHCATLQGHSLMSAAVPPLPLEETDATTTTTASPPAERLRLYRSGCSGNCATSGSAERHLARPWQASPCQKRGPRLKHAADLQHMLLHFKCLQFHADAVEHVTVSLVICVPVSTRRRLHKRILEGWSGFTNHVRRYFLARSREMDKGLSEFLRLETFQNTHKRTCEGIVRLDWTLFIGKLEGLRRLAPNVPSCTKISSRAGRGGSRAGCL